MRDLYLALTTTLDLFATPLRTRIIPDPSIETRWRIRVEDPRIPNSLLEVEILNLDGDPVGCILHRSQFAFRTMDRFMTALMDHLEEIPHPPGGSPTA